MAAMETPKCGCSEQISRSAEPISPPVAALSHDNSCYVDFEGCLYAIFWNGQMQYPDLSSFPRGSFTTNKLELSPKIAGIYSNSSLVKYGADACVRCFHEGPFPIVKIAVPNEQSRCRVRYDFEMLCKLSKNSLPLPKFDPVPLNDEHGIVGYRMGRLFDLEYSEQKRRVDELEGIIDRINSFGYVHGDLTPGNVMQDANGNLILIDFGYSGHIGSSTPEHVPKWKFDQGIFDKKIDLEYLQRFFR